MLDDKMIHFSKSIGLVEGSYNDGIIRKYTPQQDRYIMKHRTGDTIIDSDL